MVCDTFTGGSSVCAMPICGFTRRGQLDSMFIVATLHSSDITITLSSH